MKYTNKGFTCIEAIFSIWIVFLCVVLLSYSFALLSKINFSNHENEDRAFLHQMQLLYALGENHNIENGMLDFFYKHNTMYYEFQNNKLILMEGYQIFLKDIKDVYFIKERGCTYICYERDKWKKEMVGCDK